MLSSPLVLALAPPPAWVPFASALELDPDRPTPFAFDSRKFVVWADNANNWRVFDDACPHRLAPLSEGRVDREADALECAYHGWSFNGCGRCMRIPQLPDADAARRESSRASVAGYPVRLHKDVVFFWPWAGADPADAPAEVSPEHQLSSLPEQPNTYTRDLPYSYHTLVENLADPAHVPFAHHGLQGTRDDAIPIDISIEGAIEESGFKFAYADRTMGRRRTGTGEFKAPYVLTYEGLFEPTAKEAKEGLTHSRRTFNLTTACIPVGPGRSRVIVFQGDRSAKPTSLIGALLKRFPTWLSHIFSGRFLDSDLAFLHFQERELARRDISPERAATGYYMPAQADRPVAAFRAWLAKYGGETIRQPLSLVELPRKELLSRWEGHTQFCVQCQSALAAIGFWRRRTRVALALSLVFANRWPARVVAAFCVCLLPLFSTIEQQMTFSDYKHYKM